jgi:hypothetical protein
MAEVAKLETLDQHIAYALEKKISHILISCNYVAYGQLQPVFRAGRLCVFNGYEGAQSEQTSQR